MHYARLGIEKSPLVPARLGIQRGLYFGDVDALLPRLWSGGWFAPAPVHRNTLLCFVARDIYKASPALA